MPIRKHFITRLYRIDRIKDIRILDDLRSEAVARQEAQMPFTLMSVRRNVLRRSDFRFGGLTNQTPAARLRNAQNGAGYARAVPHTMKKK